MYHLEWCPKYRYNVLRKQENKNLCKQILIEVAERHNIKITEISVLEDHIHLIASLPPTMSVSKSLHLLKGASAYEIFKRKPQFRKRYPRGHLWSPGKFYRTAGDMDLETVTNYVKKQRLVQTKLDGS
jgi:putative transposase